MELHVSNITDSSVVLTFFPGFNYGKVQTFTIQQIVDTRNTTGTTL